MTLPPKPDLTQLPDRYRLILCDLWGCVHNGVAAFEGTLALLRGWRAQGRTIVFLTNAPRPAAAVTAQLDRLGVTPDFYDGVASSGDAALAYIAGAYPAGSQFGFIGQDKDAIALRDRGIELCGLDEAKDIICCGFYDDHPNDLAFHAADLAALQRRDATMLCFNPDQVVIRGEREELCAGAIARAFEDLGGTVRYFGKPKEAIYAHALTMAGSLTGRSIPRGDVLAIGDSFSTDLAGAAAFGIDFLLVAGGIETERLAVEGETAMDAQLSASGQHEDFNLLGIVQRLAGSDAGTHES